MSTKNIVMAALAATVALGPVTRAAAGSGDFAAGIVGGIIAGAALNAASNKRKPTKRVYVNPGVVSATRVQNRETQTALNYFSFNAGTPDGVLGRNSRAAISAYQAFMQFPVTGNLTEFERSILVSAYQRGLAGAPETLRMVSRDPNGTKALLLDQKTIMAGGGHSTPRVGYAGLPIEVSEAIDEIADSSDPSAEQLLQRSGFIQLADMNGDGNNDYILDTSFSGSSFWCNSVQCKTIVFVSTANGYARNDLLAFDPTPASFECAAASCRVVEAPETTMASAEPDTAAPDTTMVSASDTPAPTGTGTLTPLTGLSNSGPGKMLSSHCSKVTLLTNANGGYTTVADMTSPDLVLNEQFCLARAFALDTGEQMMGQLQNVSAADVETQCGQFSEALKPYVASLSLKPRADVVRDTGAFVLGSGADPASLVGTAKICLATGYQKDDMNMAIGSALLLVVLGEAPYSELMGHHLKQGFGTPERLDLAVSWYEAALNALDQGAQPVFAAAQVDRAALLSAAVVQLQGGDSAQTETMKVSAPASLPTFSVAD